MYSRGGLRLSDTLRMEFLQQRIQPLAFEALDLGVAAVGVVTTGHDETLSARERCVRLAISDQARVVEDLQARLVEELARLTGLVVALGAQPARQEPVLHRSNGNEAEIADRAQV